MKKFIFITFLLLLSCKAKEKIFNGDIVIVKQPATKEILQGIELKFDGIYTGGISVYDSLIYFTSGKFPDYWIYVFNTKNGKHINSVARKGQGPDEFVGINGAGQHYVDNNSIYVWIHDYYKNDCLLFDLLNDSVKTKFNISKLKREQRSYPFGRVFVLNDSLLLAFSQGEEIYNDPYLLPPLYQVYNYRTNEELAKYEFYNKFKYNKRLMPQGCLYSFDRIKPDLTKLAMGMSRLRQINIMDIETGKVTGYRIEGSPDFDILEENSAYEYAFYYLWICVDNDYIYAILNNDKDENHTTIDIFDWNGNFKQVLILDKKMVEINTVALDPVNKYLYILSLGEKDEEVYRYDVSHLYSQK
jgi:hypothetical protein